MDEHEVADAGLDLLPLELPKMNLTNYVPTESRMEESFFQFGSAPNPAAEVTLISRS